MTMYAWETLVVFVANTLDQIKYLWKAKDVNVRYLSNPMIPVQKFDTMTAMCDSGIRYGTILRRERKQKSQYNLKFDLCTFATQPPLILVIRVWIQAGPGWFVENKPIESRRGAVAKWSKALHCEGKKDPRFAHDLSNLCTKRVWLKLLIGNHLALKDRNRRVLWLD